jgi:hypothetical protein
MAITVLPAAVETGGICESIAGPGTAAEIVDWAIHLGSSFIRFQNRPLRFRFDDWRDESRQKIKDMRRSPFEQE